MAPSTDTIRIDLRTLTLQERLSAVFKAFGRTRPGEAVELIDDHSPQALQGELLAQWPGGFSWNDVVSGPALWRVRIVRRANHPDDRCCGACGGA